MGAIRLTSVFSGNNRKLLVANDENNHGNGGMGMDGMEWDDSGLNITENPLEKIEVNFLKKQIE